MLGTIQHDRVAGPGRLVGDFAYALWDATTLRLRLARDAMGMRSLYYRVEKDRVLWCDRGSDVVVASVPLSFDEPSNAYVLEGISAEFWRLLMSHGSLDRAVQTLLERYQVARTQLEADLAVLAEQMCVEGLLVDRAASPCFAGSVDP